MKNFELHRIKPPGKVNLPKIGTIDLDKIDDKLAEKLYKQGVPFIRPKTIHIAPMPDDDPYRIPDSFNDHSDDHSFV